MSKSKSKVPAEQGVATTVTVLRMAEKYKPVREGTARAKWLERLQAYDGKPVAEWVADTTLNPPSLPEKGKSAGKAEAPSGWLAWFLKNGYATTEDVAQ